MHSNLPVVKELVVQGFLSLDRTPDIIIVKTNPNTALCTSLVNVDLQDFAKIAADCLNLVLNVDEEAWILAQVNFLLVKNIFKQKTVGWECLGDRQMRVC